MAEGLRFCMVTTFYPPFHFGGDAIYVHRLAQALAAAGHKVDVIHSMDAYRLRPSEAPEGGWEDHPNVTRHPLESASPRLATVFAHQLGRPVLYDPRLRPLLEQDYDVIHYHNVSLMGAPEVLRLGRAVKLYTAHEYWLVCPTHVLFAFDRKACTEKRCLPCTLSYGRAPQAWRYTERLRRALEHVDTLLMPSRFAWERHQAEGISRPLVVLPHFVPEAEPSVPREDVAERPYFLYVGRLEKLKGVQDLVRLFAEERRADLVIAGDGSYRPTLEAMARGLTQVRFVGNVPPSNLGELYRRAVALLAPSLCYETFGLTAAEAMSHATPVIVRRIGALEEMVEQSGGGFTFSTLAECREVMDRLLGDPELRAELGRRGAAAVRARWSSAGHLQRYLDLVDSLLAARGGRRSRVEPAPARVPVLTWHSLDESGSVISTSASTFRSQIAGLRERGFQGVSLRELVDAWEGHAPLPPKPVVLTFDDGFRSVLEVAQPILHEAGFRATVFAVAGYCGRRNDWPGQGAGIPTLPLLSQAELRALAAGGFEVGAHGMTHARLDRLPAAEAEREIVDSGRSLEDAIGEKLTAFAYPYGRTTTAARRVAAAHYRVACTTELRVASSDDDREALGRLDMYYFRRPLALRLLGTRVGDGYVGLRRLGRGLRALGDAATGPS